jgi:hypothetical protein
MPQKYGSYTRLFAGVDGMVTNGLRYGRRGGNPAELHRPVRQQRQFRASGETLFAYIAGENWAYAPFPPSGLPRRRPSRAAPAGGCRRQLTRRSNRAY